MITHRSVDSPAIAFNSYSLFSYPIKLYPRAFSAKLDKEEGGSTGENTPAGR
jgi:hypothetical protein